MKKNDVYRESALWLAQTLQAQFTRHPEMFAGLDRHGRKLLEIRLKEFETAAADVDAGAQSPERKRSTGRRR